MISSTWPFESVVRGVVEQLASGEYAALERRTRGVRLSALELATSVDVSLHTAEEGRSDLTLQLTIRATEGDDFDVEIDHLHVL